MTHSPKTEQALRNWGRWYGWERAGEWDEDSSLTTAGLTGALVSRLKVGMEKIGAEPVLGERFVRIGGGVVISQRFTAKGKQSQSGGKPMYMDPKADAVERIVLDLHRLNHRRALVLRAEYCTRGAHREKMSWVNRRDGVQRISLRQFRAELDRAREWVEAQTQGAAA